MRHTLPGPESYRGGGPKVATVVMQGSDYTHAQRGGGRKVIMHTVMQMQSIRSSNRYQAFKHQRVKAVLMMYTGDVHLPDDMYLVHKPPDDQEQVVQHTTESHAQSQRGLPGTPGAMWRSSAIATQNDVLMQWQHSMMLCCHMMSQQSPHSTPCIMARKRQPCSPCLAATIGGGSGRQQRVGQLRRRRRITARRPLMWPPPTGAR